MILSFFEKIIYYPEDIMNIFNSVNHSISLLNSINTALMLSHPFCSEVLFASVVSKCFSSTFYGSTPFNLSYLMKSINPCPSVSYFYQTPSQPIIKKSSYFVKVTTLTYGLQEIICLSYAND